MTEVQITKRNHNNFAGIIDVDDFSTFLPNKKRTKNYASADHLKKEFAEKRKLEELKHMTLEELREMKLVSNSNGRPTSTLTDEKWQKEFQVRKLFVKPVGKKVTKLSGKHSRESGMWNSELNGEYLGTTNWQDYCCYMNDVLRNIRAGQVDYCYFIYQITTLLKFHYNNLRTRYRDGYWEVWLEK